ncbi:MAG: PDZ domain-containing protein [Verrucomicrobiales bacterium]|nr:PDZ domain-containing protein [Verrucomicrobiales bacterium]
MKNLLLSVLFVGLWAVSTAIDISAQSDERKDAPERAEAEKPRVDRERKPEPPKRGEAPRRGPESKGEPSRSVETQTWLGVATAPLPESLREYLEVEEGFGVQIFQVLEDSPASDAGLKANDVLVLFDDQMLISPEHLSLLVKRLKEGDEVKVTVIRKGLEKELKVTLGETEYRPFVRPGGPDGDRNFRSGHGSVHPQSRQWEEAVRRQQDHLQRWMKDHGALRNAEAGEPGEDRLDPGKPPAISVRPGFPVKVLSADGVIKIDNEKGELVITNKEGEHEMVLKDEKGNFIYEGEYDPEAGIEGLPEAARKHLREMKLDDLKVLTPEAPAPKPENASQPLERASLGNAPKELL